jgi:glycosyltransferase involved in cell wall biosynthesis
MTRLSILIPVYNQARYLPECLNSVLNQEFADFEAIAIDDGSTDESLSILKQFAGRDRRLKVISQPNGGYGRAMNAGLAAAQGIYIGIVESDDTVDPRMYAELFKAADQTGADIVKCSFRRIFSNRLQSEERGWYDAAGKRFSLKEHPELCRLHPAIWTAIYKRRMLTDNRIVFSEPPGASYQDVPLFAETFSATESIYIIPKALYHYRLESANAFSSSNAIDERVFYRLHNHRLARAVYEKRGLWDIVKYPELQREFITLNNFCLRITPRLRKRFFHEIRDYFKDIPASEADRFLSPSFGRSFKLIKKGRYLNWLLRYAIGYIIILWTARHLGLIDRIRQLYFRWQKKEPCAQ